MALQNKIVSPFCLVIVGVTFIAIGGLSLSQDNNLQDPKRKPVDSGPALDTKQVFGGSAGASSQKNEQDTSAILKDSASRSWQTYDISNYTTSVKSVPNPEKNVLDWILRETGTDTWFGESVAALSVGRHSIRCYHNAEVQQKVRSIVDRFAKTHQRDEVFGFQVLTVTSPNWRAKLSRLLTKIETQTPGVEGWTAPKENAAHLFSELRKRADFHHPISQTLITESGQPKKVVRQIPLTYFQSIRLDSRAIPPFRVETQTIQEGYVFRLSSLRSLDGKKMDAELFCDVNQVEQFKHVKIDVPGPNGTSQKHPISIPVRSNWRIKERFQWPVDRVLVLSAGIVAAPDRKIKPTQSIQDVFEPNKNQAEVLILVDCKGQFPRGKAPKSAYRLVPLQNRR